jgi:hypothetical protein
MPTIVLHLSNEDPILGEIETIPAAGDTSLLLKNPRRRDGKDVPYLDGNITSVIFPMHRVSFIEIVVTEGEEEIISHVREK